MKIVKASWKNARKAAREIRIHNHKNPNMLARTPREIKNSDFWVALNKCNKLVGFIGIIIWGPDGVEIVSHLTLEKFRGTKAGEELLMKAIRKAREISSDIFLFTTEVEYYEKFDFEVVSAKNFTEKIKARCCNCKNGPLGPGNPPCPEVAMKYRIFKCKKSSESNAWMFPYFG